MSRKLFSVVVALTAALSVAAPSVAAAERPAVRFAAVAKAVITAQPATQHVVAGATVQFRVTAVGVDLSYLWQEKLPGGNFVTVSSAPNTNSLSVAAVSGRNQAQYRVLVRNPGGQTISATATLVVDTPRAVIRSQPTLQHVLVGTTVQFRVIATGLNLSYIWQEQLPGKSFVSIPSATLSYHNTVATPARNKAQYRVLIRNSGGQVISAAALLVVDTPRAAITGQPASSHVSAGQTVQFRVSARGYGLTYRWQQKAPGGGWTYTPGAVASFSNVRASTARSGYQFRAVVTNPGGQVFSAPATMTVDSTRADPVRANVAKNMTDWRVNVLTTNTDAWAEVNRDLSIKEPPAAGSRYVVAFVNVRYLKTGTGDVSLDLDVSFVGSDNRTYTDTSKLYWSNNIYAIDDLYQNGTAQFATIVEVPVAAVTGGRWRIDDTSDYSNETTVWYGLS